MAFTQIKTPVEQQDKTQALKKENKDKTNTDKEKHKIKNTRLDLAVQYISSELSKKSLLSGCSLDRDQETQVIYIVTESQVYIKGNFLA